METVTRSINYVLHFARSEVMSGMTSLTFFHTGMTSLNTTNQTESMHILNESLNKEVYYDKPLDQQQESVSNQGNMSGCFMALKPWPGGYVHVPPEVQSGHGSLRMRSYPLTPRPFHCRHCCPWIFNTLIMPKICDGVPKVDLLILITTVPLNTRGRHAIRKTWGQFSKLSQQDFVVRHLFLFGSGWTEQEQKIIQGEDLAFRDVLQDDYVDSYYNLSLKVLSGYRWSKKHCETARHIMRTADDNFINVPNVMKLIKEREKEMRYVITGDCSRGTFPYRDVTNKWYVTPEEYPQLAYPPYCVGTAFVTSRRMTDSIVAKSVSVPYFAIEDVYFGMVMREVVGGLKPTTLELHDFGYRAGGAIQYRTRDCALPRTWLSIHEVKEHQVPILWEKCQKDKGVYGLH